MNNKSVLHLWLAVTLCTLTITRLYCQAPVTLRGTVVRSIKSENVRDMEYQLNISLPPEYQSTTAKYPVLFYLDAWMTTGIMTDAFFMANAMNQIQPIILVGISFDGDASKFLFNRSRDYTPTFVSQESLGKDAPLVPTSGQAMEFLKFMKLELVPFIEDEYRIDTQDLGLLGYSLGGLFATWVLIEDSNMFKRYGICSPSLQWDDFFIMKRIAELSPESEKIVFLSMTAQERRDVQERFPQLKKILAENRHVRLQLAEFAQEKHATGIPATYMKALLTLYQKPQGQ
jgi:predicted alpha/beta superfamily hydrolase